MTMSTTATVSAVGTTEFLYFSWRNDTQPLPPSPAAIDIGFIKRTEFPSPKKGQLPDRRSRFAKKNETPRRRVC